jgi:hypothetical protein
VGAGNDCKLYVAAFDPSKREIIGLDKETAEREGMVIYNDPYLDNAVNVPGPAAAYKCPLCGTNDLKFHRVGHWD